MMIDHAILAKEKPYLSCFRGTLSQFLNGVIFRIYLMTTMTVNGVVIKLLSVGNSDFKETIVRSFYYFDKLLLSTAE